MTRITFTAPDGTEYDLRDQLTNGQPAQLRCATEWDAGFNRGRTFVTADGTSATFISDDDIKDLYYHGENAEAPATGYMMLRDGTRFRVVAGDIVWMRDRNGNKITFTYTSGHWLASATDSLNRQVTVNGNSEISYKGSGGAARTIEIGYAELGNALRSDSTLQSPAQLFPELSNSTSGSYNPTVYSYLDLPDGRRYQFKYNSYGELARVVLPTGGAIEYDYAAGLTDGAASGYFTIDLEKHIYRRVIERRVYPDGGTGAAYESKMTYSRPETTSGNLGYVVTEQRDMNGGLLGLSHHYFHGGARVSFGQQPYQYPGWQDSREYLTKTFSADGVTLLRQVEQTFEQREEVAWWTGSSATEPPNDVRLIETVSTLADSNQVSKQTFDYDDSVPYNNQNNIKEYDYGTGAAGALLRETRTTYLTASNYTGTDVHLRSLATQVSVRDGGGVERARTTSEYDNYANDDNHDPLIPRSGISGFDTAFNTGYSSRGNVTATTRYLLDNDSVTGSVSAYAQYDIAGNVVKTIDGRGFATAFEYDDCFGVPDGEAQANSAPTELASQSQFSYAFATKVTNALGHVAYGQFDYYLGRPVDGEDANGSVASGYYNDVLDRPTQVRRAVGTTLANQTTFNYDDVNRVITTTSDFNSNNDNLLLSKVFYDMMGRTTESRQYEGGTNYTASQQQYDALGRAYRSSNPFRPWQSESPVWTTSAFDALGRVTSITTPDNAVVSTSYSGNTVTVTDQDNKKRKSVTDALGRLKEVYEDPNSLNYLTSYSYDVLDNLTTVLQGSQNRTFVYDSLKRLTSATNPEVCDQYGTPIPIVYAYDNNGNLTQKTDARGVVSGYVYDALNRNTTIDYSDTTTINPDVTRFYDGAINGKGRFWYSYAGGNLTVGANVEHTAIDNYDALGRPSVQRQLFKVNGTWSAQTYETRRSYNLAGGVTLQTYPSGHTVSNAYDAAGRTNSFAGNLGDGTQRTYATGITYASGGQMKQEQFGTTTAVYNKLSYNSRQQLSEIRASTTGNDDSWNRGKILNQYSLQCSGAGCNATDNNGNLRKQEVYIPNIEPNTGSTSWHQQYDYDSLNRLERAHEYTGNTELDWQQEYAYDRWGNRTLHQTNTWGSGINKKEFIVNPVNNRLGVPGGQAGAMTYDNAGNLTTDTYSGSGVTRTYDAENRMTSETQAENYVAGSYTYNADGQRVRRKVGSLETWQVYGFDGELLGEYAAGGAATAPQKEYGYRNGQLLITAEAPVPAVNVALAANGATVTASSAYSGWAASGTINGDRKGLNGGQNGGWVTAQAGFPAWLQVDFNGSKTISEIDVFTLQDNWQTPAEPTEAMTFNTLGLTGYDVQYWSGSAWVTVTGGNITGNNKVWRKFTFAAITTTKFRVLTNASADGYSRLAEVEAWTGTAPPPPPARTNFGLAANGATATASSAYSGWAASGAINGDRKGLNGGQNGGWVSAQTGFPAWLQVDFNGSKTIDEVDVFTLQNNWSNPSEPTEAMTFSLYGLTGYEVQYWNGTGWVTVTGGSVTANNKVWRKFTFSPITTTKIRVLTNAAIDGYSRLTEVEAWSPAEGATNLALGKPATQISDHHAVTTANRAVDGNTNGNQWENGYTAGTNSHLNSWWQVDLQSVQSIGSIEVWGRTDCCPEMISNFYVFVSDSPFGSYDLNTTLTQAGVKTITWSVTAARPALSM